MTVGGGDSASVRDCASSLAEEEISTEEAAEDKVRKCKQGKHKQGV